MAATVEQALAGLEQYLSPEQLERAAALAFARVVMTIGVPAPEVKEPSLPSELVDLAEYVVTASGQAEDGGDD